VDVGSAEGLRVVIADGNHLARRGLADVLAQAGAQVVGQATTAEQALRVLADTTPEVLLVSLDLPGTQRGHIVAIARDRWPGMAVVALSETLDDTAMLAALELGASAYLPKTSEPDRFVAAALQAAATPDGFQAKGLSGAGRRLRQRGPHLTPRESEVLALAAQGLTVAGISARLFVSEATTRSHLSGIYRKLGVTSRSQALLTAERLGMLQ
jgi:DNA-binding NarL/FixJ family response regulator